MFWRVQGLCVVLACLLVASLAPAAEAKPKCKGQKATIVGTEGDDVLGGKGGSDVIVAKGGNDQIFSGEGDDMVCAGDGDDLVDSRRRARPRPGERGQRHDRRRPRHRQDPRR